MAIGPHAEHDQVEARSEAHPERFQHALLIVGRQRCSVGQTLSNFVDGEDLVLRDANLRRAREGGAAISRATPLSKGAGHVISD